MLEVKEFRTFDKNYNMGTVYGYFEIVFKSGLTVEGEYTDYEDIGVVVTVYGQKFLQPLARLKRFIEEEIGR